MGDFSRREWARFGHSLIHVAERLFSDPAAYAVFDVLGTDYYVQWHGEDDRRRACGDLAALRGVAARASAGARGKRCAEVL